MKTHITLEAILRHLQVEFHPIYTFQFPEEQEKCIKSLNSSILKF